MDKVLRFPVIFVGIAWIISIGIVRAAWAVFDAATKRVDAAIDKLFDGWV